MSRPRKPNRNCTNIERSNSLVTRVISADDLSGMESAASCILSGGLVAFPTETVYGLGANALDPVAVRGIFQAKGRPSDNPLIVHVAEKDKIRPLVREITPLAHCMMDHFMPGPITLVMKKSHKIPSCVSANLDTVGIRIPSHPVAQKFLSLCETPVAAPSANLSGSPSPTCASHVMHDMQGAISYILDGGNCDVGLESTVLDVTGNNPVILRPGAITEEMINEACKESGVAISGVRSATSLDGSKTPSAPGMKYRHYAPKARVVIFTKEEDTQEEWIDRIREILNKQPSVNLLGVYCCSQDAFILNEKMNPTESLRVKILIYGKRGDIDVASSKLFSALRSFDDMHADVIIAEGFRKIGLAAAYMNRLDKAAGGKSEIDPRAEIKLPDLHRHVLFVCTGNTCRSPMAEVIFAQFVERNEPFCDKNQPARKAMIHVSSAGIHANEGEDASNFAMLAVNNLYGLNLFLHKSHQITKEDISQNDLIISMTDHQANILRQEWKESAAKIYSFPEYILSRKIKFSAMGDSQTHFDILDPFGQSRSVYNRTAMDLYEKISLMTPAILEDLGVLPCGPF